MISNFSANPEATYSFLSLMAIQPVSKMMAMYGWDGVDPGYSYQFLRRMAARRRSTSTSRPGWDAKDAKTYTHAYKENFFAPTMLTYLRIPGTFEYWDILDKNLSAAMSRHEERQAGARRHRPGLGAGSPSGSAATSSSRTTRPPSATSG